MEILRFKLPLKIYPPKPVQKNGYEANSVLIEEIDFNSLDLNEIDDLDGQYDWIEAWHNREFDKKTGGFDNKDVQMEVKYDKGYYIITLVSDKSFDSIVRCYKYDTNNNDYREITLKDAVVDFLEGCIWDGIGENEIGWLTYQGYKCDVWMEHCTGNLMEI